MSIATQEKRRYRVPSVSVDAAVSLDEFSDDEILEYVRERGLGDVDTITAAIGDIDTIDTLLLCGQRDAALEIISHALSHALGRVVRLQP